MLLVNPDIMRRYLAFLLLQTIFCLLPAQSDIPRDTSYTIESNFRKNVKYHPFVEPIEEQWSFLVTEHRDVTYKILGNRYLSMDIFVPAAPKKGPVPGVLMVHGGGWSSGSKAHQIPMAQQLAARGYVAVAVEYRLSPEAIFPAAVEDLREAVRWLRANATAFSLDADKIAALGCSAGAQLASLLGTLNGSTKFLGPSLYPDVSADIGAVLNIDGIVSFVHPEASAEGKASSVWLGGTREESWDTWKAASPMEYTNADTPPFLFVNSSQPRFHAGRDDFIRMLDSLGTYSEIHTLEGSPHSFWLLHPWFEPTLEYVHGFLEKLWGKSGIDPVAEQMLLWQAAEGGWPKSWFDADRKEFRVDYRKPLTEELYLQLKTGKLRGTIPTYDNYATSREINYLVKAYHQTGNVEYLAAAEKGIRYILVGQYPDNGGWPQFYPLRKGYYSHITYNDNATINNLNILFDMVYGFNGFDAVDASLVASAKTALEKGIACILNTQIATGGELKVWCAQHDSKTLEPAPARSFELVSFSGMESANIVRFLMRVPEPSEEVKIAIRQAIKWFEATKIEGYAYEFVTDEDGNRDRVFREKEGAVSWGRFYDIETNLPFSCGRDGIKKADVADIERERRVGYAWYGDWGKELLEKDWPQWLEKHGKGE